MGPSFAYESSSSRVFWTLSEGSVLAGGILFPWNKKQIPTQVGAVSICNSGQAAQQRGRCQLGRTEGWLDLSPQGCGPKGAAKLLPK